MVWKKHTSRLVNWKNHKNQGGSVDLQRIQAGICSPNAPNYTLESYFSDFSVVKTLSNNDLWLLSVWIDHWPQYMSHKLESGDLYLVRNSAIDPFKQWPLALWFRSCFWDLLFWANAPSWTKEHWKQQQQPQQHWQCCLCNGVSHLHVKIPLNGRTRAV